jgi:hypothetical protein
MSLRNLVACALLAGAFAASTAQAGAVGSAISHGDRVYARSINTYYIDFYGGEYAEVAIVGDGDTDLDLFVYDENGNLIGSGESYSDVEVVGWTPRWTGTFTVEVHNLGSVYNDFGLGSN